jgi:hypothetical protein
VAVVCCASAAVFSLELGAWVAVAASDRFEIKDAGHSFAAALMHVSTVVTPPAPTAQKLGMGLRWSCREKTFGGMLEAMERTAPARPATPPNGSTTTFARNRWV